MIQLNSVIEFFGNKYKTVVTDEEYVVVWSNRDGIRKGDALDLASRTNLKFPMTGKAYTNVRYTGSEQDAVSSVPYAEPVCISECRCEDGSYLVVNFIDSADIGSLIRAADIGKSMKFYTGEILHDAKRITDMIESDRASEALIDGLTKKITARAEEAEYCMDEKTFTEWIDASVLIREFLPLIRKVMPGIHIVFKCHIKKSGGTYIMMSEQAFIIAFANIISAANNYVDGNLNIHMQKDVGIVRFTVEYPLKKPSEIPTDFELMGGGAVRRTFEIAGGVVRCSEESGTVKIVATIPRAESALRVTMRSAHDEIYGPEIRAEMFLARAKKI